MLLTGENENSPTSGQLYTQETEVWEHRPVSHNVPAPFCCTQCLAHSYGVMTMNFPNRVRCHQKRPLKAQFQVGGASASQFSVAVSFINTEPKPYVMLSFRHAAGFLSSCQNCSASTMSRCSYRLLSADSANNADNNNACVHFPTDNQNMLDSNVMSFPAQNSNLRG